MKRIALILFIVFFCHMGAWGDNIRGPFGGNIILNGSGAFSQEIRLKLEDIASITLDNVNSEILKAVELEVKIPNAIRKYRDSFALFFYHTVKPEPKPETTFYRGEQITFEVIPTRNMIYFQLPVKADVSLPASPDTVFLSRSVRPEQMPLLITFLPVMKGIPSFVLSSEFRIRGRALVEEIGFLDLVFTFPEGETPGPFTLHIDGKTVDPEKDRHSVEAGMHLITITSDIYKNADLNFGIETGKTTLLEHTLEKQATRIFIEKPEEALLFIDGEKFNIPSGTGLDITQGEHTVLFKLGDYSFSKKVYIERGKEYDVFLFMDIIVHDKE